MFRPLYPHITMISSLTMVFILSHHDIRFHYGVHTVSPRYQSHYGVHTVSPRYQVSLWWYSYRLTTISSLTMVFIPSHHDIQSHYGVHTVSPRYPISLWCSYRLTMISSLTMVFILSHHDIQSHYGVHTVSPRYPVSLWCSYCLTTISGFTMVFIPSHHDIRFHYGVHTVSLNSVYGSRVITREQAHRQTVTKTSFRVHQQVMTQFVTQSLES
jgi:hypothetical protein